MGLTSIILRRSQGHHLWRSLLHLPSSYPIHFPVIFFYSSSPDSLPASPIATPHDGLSDFEPEPEPVGPTKVDIHDLHSFIQILASAKYLSSSPKQAMTLLNSSSAVQHSKELVCRAMWEVRKDWELALFAFRWGELCVASYPWAWHFIIQVVCKKERFDLAWVFVQKMYRNGILTQRAIVIIMEWYAAINQAGKAMKTFCIIEKFKLNADMEIFQSLLRALCKNQNIEEAEKLLLTNWKTFPLNSENFNIILDGWCNIMPDIVEAKRVWREMSNYCISPDGTSYMHMIRCFAKARNLSDSLKLYGEMKKKGWAPALEVYNSLIYVLMQENCLKEANNVLKRIHEAGLNPNVETYNCMIHQLCESQKFVEAQALMEEMTVKGIKPNYETYHPFINQDDAEATSKILRKMKENGCGPYGSTFLFLLEKYFSSKESGNALKFWYEMKNYQIKPDHSHYMVLVKGLAKFGWLEKALEYYNEMKEKGCGPDIWLEKMFNTFLLNNKEHLGRVDGKFDTLQGANYNLGSKGANLHSRGSNINACQDLG